MRTWFTAIAVGYLLSAASCGGGEPAPETPFSATQATVVKSDAGSGTPGGTEQKLIVEGVPGVRKIPVAQFVEFAGFRHGDDRDAATNVLAWKAKGLGPRQPLEMTGSAGFRFPSHLVISWSTESRRLDYISVRSQAAVEYLASKRKPDPRLAALFGRSINEARSALGKPTLEADRPHAITYRYDFASGAQHGTLSLEFNKLEAPPTCSSVSVHWN